MLNLQCTLLLIIVLIVKNSSNDILVGCMSVFTSVPVLQRRETETRCLAKRALIGSSSQQDSVSS